MKRFFNIYNIKVRTLQHSFGSKHKHRVVHISDLHIGNFDVNHVRTIVNIINNISCDFVVFTGDVVCDRHEELSTEILEVLNTIKYNVFAVMGNHDYNLYTKSTKREKVDSFRTVQSKLTNIGWRYLINENVTINGLQLMGTDDHGDDKWSMNRGDIDKAMIGVDITKPTIVLTHNPTYVNEIIFKYEPSLILCGHTHAGQVGFSFNLFGKRFEWSFASKYEYWLDTYYRKNTTIHVNRGLGYDMLPIRTFAPEITIHEIK